MILQSGIFILVQYCHKLTTSLGFARFIVFLIVLSGLLAGAETYPAFSEGTVLGNFVQVLQNLILFVFFIEIVLKIIACGDKPWTFFLQPWNVFDCVILSVCLLPLNMHSASVVRMARILRALRMITVLPKLRLLVNALLRSIPSLGYIGVLLGLHFYIYSVVGTVTFGANDPIRFGSLHATASTLFQVLTLEGWNDVRDTQVLGSDVAYDDAWKELSKESRVSRPRPLLSTIYFISFILLGTMIMLNLFTGVIITSMEEAQDEVKSRGTQSQLKERGFLTLHDELNQVSSQLQLIMEQMSALQERAAQLQSAKTPPSRQTSNASSSGEFY
ncbi:MAG: ion transporter [Pirellulaceae bacterium]|nr:ion transporter [Pirellulaceae bacterium]